MLIHDMSILIIINYFTRRKAYDHRHQQYYEKRMFHCVFNYVAAKFPTIIRLPKKNEDKFKNRALKNSRTRFTCDFLFDFAAFQPTGQHPTIC